MGNGAYDPLASMPLMPANAPQVQQPLPQPQMTPQQRYLMMALLQQQQNPSAVPQPQIGDVAPPQPSQLPSPTTPMQPGPLEAAAQSGSQVPNVGQGSQTGAPDSPPTPQSIAGQIAGAPPGAPPGTPPLPQQPQQLRPPGTVGMPGPVAAPPPEPQTPDVMANRQRILEEKLAAVDAASKDVMAHQPGLGRRILAGAFGAMAGLHDPQSGMAVGRMMMNTGPYARRLEQAKGELKTAEEAYGVESQAQKQRADIQKIQQDIKQSNWNMDPQRLAEATEQARIQGKTEVQLEGTDPAGNNFAMVYDRSTGRSYRPDGQPIPPGSTADLPKSYVAQAQIQGRTDVANIGAQSRKDVAQLRVDAAKALDEQRYQEKAKLQNAEDIAKLERQDAEDKARINRLDIEAAQRLDLQDHRHLDRLQELSVKAAQPPTAVRTVAHFATVALERANAVDDAVTSLDKANKIGPFAGRFNDLWANKLGMNDPDFVAFDQSMQSLADEYARAQNNGRPNVTQAQRYLHDFRASQTAEDLHRRIAEAEKALKDFQAVGGIMPGATPMQVGTGQGGINAPVNAPGAGGGPPPGATIVTPQLNPDGTYSIPK